jgi:hypothetical protein
LSWIFGARDKELDQHDSLEKVHYDSIENMFKERAKSPHQKLYLQEFNLAAFPKWDRKRSYENSAAQHQ